MRTEEVKSLDCNQLSRSLLWYDYESLRMGKGYSRKVHTRKNTGTRKAEFASSIHRVESSHSEGCHVAGPARQRDHNNALPLLQNIPTALDHFRHL